MEAVLRMVRGAQPGDLAAELGIDRQRLRSWLGAAQRSPSKAATSEGAGAAKGPAAVSLPAAAESPPPIPHQVWPSRGAGLVASKPSESSENVIAPQSQAGAPVRLPWWLKLPRGIEGLQTITCPNCGTIHSPIDAVCDAGSCEERLFDLDVRPRTQAAIKNALRTAAALTAGSVGYVGFLWAPYAFQCVVVLLLLAVFLRRWPLGLSWALFLSSISAVLVGLVGSLPSDVQPGATGVIALGTLLPLPLFSYSATNFFWYGRFHSEKQITGRVVASMAMMMALAFISLATYALVSELELPFFSLIEVASIRVAFCSSAGAIAAAVVAATVSNVRGPALAALPVLWKSPLIIQRVHFRRIPAAGIGPTGVLVRHFQRFASGTTNRLMSAAERLHYAIVVIPTTAVLGAARSAANFFWSMLTSALRHAMRITWISARSFVLMSRCLREIAQQYGKAYVLPALLMVSCAALLHLSGAGIVRQLQSGDSLRTMGAVAIEALAALLVVFLTIVALTGAKPAEFARQYLSAVVHFSIEGYFLFLVVMWMMAGTAWALKMPYTIGLGTLGATLLLPLIVLATFLLQRVSGQNPSPEKKKAS
jgi:hypothetical protein